MKKLTLFAILIALFFTSCSTGNKVEFIEKENQIDVVINEKLITSYLHGPDLLKPCLYPVNSPSGEILTRSYPFKELEGESKDHPHHTGMYFTYASKGEVNGDSFWNIHPVPPQIKHIKVLETESGKNEGEITTLSHWINRDNKPILEEKREMEFEVLEDKYIIDFTIELKATDEAVTFEDTKEGMFAIRVVNWLNEKGTGEYLNAEGDKKEKGVWGKQSSWVRLEGQKDDKTIGIAIYHHPESVNYPTYWHARGYGCFAANPIGRYDFQKGRGEDNPVKRSLTIKPGETALFKFRMTIYEGESTKEQFEQEFVDFSKE